MERRNHSRVEGSHPAVYFTDIHSNPKVATAVDLSMGGTRIETPYGLITGEGLEITIAIQPQVIKCRGEVVHVLELVDDRPKAGVRFKRMSKKDRLHLGQYLASIMEQEA